MNEYRHCRETFVLEQSLKRSSRPHVINTLTAIMTLSWNKRGEMKTQKMSYTNAALRSADATCQNSVRYF